MKAAVIANGNNEKSINSDEYQLIICADGATQWALDNNVRIDVAVGDMDSVDGHILQGIEEVIRFNCEKDETDSRLALDLAFDRGADEVHFYGALGGRLDHEMANIALLLRYAKEGKRVILVDKKSRTFVANGKISLAGRVGQQVSLLPMAGDVMITHTKGLKYPVANKMLPVDTPYFISNVYTETEVEIETQGWVAVIHPEI